MNKEEQDEREDRATEAIICGILRGYTEQDWQSVFRGMEQDNLALDHDDTPTE
jgi:hypothetical protein